MSTLLSFLRRLFFFAVATALTTTPLRAGDPPHTVHWGATHDFTDGIEGPTLGPDGLLYVPNYQRPGTIGRVGPDGLAELFLTLPGDAISAALRFVASTGDFFVLDYVGHNVFKVDLKTRAVRVFAHDARMNQPNDLALGPDGSIYLSDPSWARSTGNLWRIGPQGQVRLIESGIGTTNGLTFDAQGRYLYVDESVQRKIWRYEFDEAGRIKEKLLFFDLGDLKSLGSLFPKGMLDGLKFGPDGLLYAAVNGSGVIAVFSTATETGKLVGTIKTFGQHPSNLTFSGNTAYVTEVDCGCVQTFTAPKLKP